MSPNPNAEPATATRLSFACPRCRAPMHELALASHKGHPVTVEQCPDCRLVWFDRFESVHLDAQGWVRLLREMESAARRPLAQAKVEHPACPICAGRLNPVQNRTRFGLFAALECRHGHGHLHSHTGLLSERGLVRPPGLAERRALAEEKLALHCLNCGGPAAGGDEQCRYCRTPLLVLDLPRLAHSLRPRAELLAASPRDLGHHHRWPCRGCGAPLDPGREIKCPRCDHMVVAHDLPDIDPLLDTAEAELAELAAIEARRLSRYPSTHHRPAPRAAPEPVAPTRLQRVMLFGWTPLLLLFSLAIAWMLAAFNGVVDAPRTPLDALREERLATAPGTGWIWLPAHRAVNSVGGDAERTALREGLFDVYLRQLDGEALPATLTIGQLIDRKLPPPADASDRDTRARWNRLLARQLKPVSGGMDLPRTDETTSPYTRWALAAPGVWVDEQSRYQGIWLLTVENTGAFSWRAGALPLSMGVHDNEDLLWRCRPAPDADPLVPPHGRLQLFCVTRVAPSMQEDRWRMAMIMLQGGEPLELSWQDELMRSSGGLAEATDRWAAQAAKGSARLADFLQRQGLMPPGAVGSPGLAMAKPAPNAIEAPPPLTWRQRWSGLSGSGRAQFFAALALAGFVVFCTLARALGERRGYVVAMLFAAALSCWLGWGEGAASVLFIAMFMCLSMMATFVFGFGYRSYRDIVFRRFG